MNIIVEGIDRSGKSTVCDFLVKNQFSYYHFDYPRESDVVSIYERYFNENTQFLKDCVFDRAMYSEWVYSRYYDRKSTMSIQHINYFENLFKSKSNDGNACLLYVENEISQNLSLLNEEGEGKIQSIDQIIQLRKYYYEIMRKSSLPIFTYNYNFQRIEDVFSQIKSFFKDRN